jgi:hypothetical protein
MAYIRPVYDSTEPLEIPMNFVKLLQTLIVIGTLQSPVADSPHVKVLVLDALDGKPQAGVIVPYLCDEIPHSTTTQTTTDAAGIAVVPYTCKAGNKIELWAVPTNLKEGCGGGVAATAEEIALTGVISRPDSAGGIWCPTKISRRLTPVPEQVTLFVKKPTWWQSHIAG